MLANFNSRSSSGSNAMTMMTMIFNIICDKTFNSWNPVLTLSCLYTQYTVGMSKSTFLPLLLLLSVFFRVCCSIRLLVCFLPFFSTFFRQDNRNLYNNMHTKNNINFHIFFMQIQRKKLNKIYISYRNSLIQQKKTYSEGERARERNE